MSEDVRRFVIEEMRVEEAVADEIVEEIERKISEMGLRYIRKELLAELVVVKALEMDLERRKR